MSRYGLFGKDAALSALSSVSSGAEGFPLQRDPVTAIDSNASLACALIQADILLEVTVNYEFMQLICARRLGANLGASGVD